MLNFRFDLKVPFLFTNLRSVFDFSSSLITPLFWLAIPSTLFVLRIFLQKFITHQVFFRVSELQSFDKFYNELFSFYGEWNKNRFEPIIEEGSFVSFLHESGLDLFVHLAGRSEEFYAFEVWFVRDNSLYTSHDYFCY